MMSLYCLCESKEERERYSEMDREQFYSFVKYSVQDVLNEHGIEGKVELQEVLKSNDQALTGLVFRGEGEKISPCVYLNDMYERYQDGLPVEYIVSEVADLMEDARNPEIDLSKFTEYEKAKEYLSFRLVGLDENEIWLNDKVWEPMGDFAKVCCLEMGQETTGYMSAVVTMGNLALMGVTKEQILSDAQKNLEKKEYVFMNLADVMASMCSEFSEIDPAETPEMPLYMLTNSSKIQGAVMIARPDIMKEIGERFGCDFYVLPSSKHEVLLVPVDAGIDLGVLSAMVRDVNAAEVSVYDKLSDKVQFYDREKELLRSALEPSEKEMKSGKSTKEKDSER